MTHQNPLARKRNILAATVVLLVAGLLAVPPAAATHEEQPPAPWEVVCPQDAVSCGWDNLGGWWGWLTHTPFPVAEPCLPTSQPACM